MISKIFSIELNFTHFQESFYDNKLKKGHLVDCLKNWGRKRRRKKTAVTEMDDQRAAKNARTGDTADEATASSEEDYEEMVNYSSSLLFNFTLEN